MTVAQDAIDSLIAKQGIENSVSPTFLGSVLQPIYDATQTVFEQDLRATDFTNQVPGVGVDTTVAFNSTAQNTVSDPVMIGADNIITFNTAEQFWIRPSVSYGRTASGGTARVFLRVVVDPGTGTFIQQGVTFDVTLINSGSKQLILGNFFISPQAGWRLKLEFHVQAGADAGLFANLSVPSGWFNAYSADIQIGRLKEPA